jgi:hypothetical protein
VLPGQPAVHLAGRPDRIGDGSERACAPPIQVASEGRNRFGILATIV